MSFVSNKRARFDPGLLTVYRCRCTGPREIQKWPWLKYPRSNF